MTDMTIKAVRTTMLRVPWPDTPWLKGHAFGEARNFLVLEVETKGGIVGMGYLFAFRPGLQDDRRGAGGNHPAARDRQGRDRRRGHLERSLEDDRDLQPRRHRHHGDVGARHRAVGRDRQARQPAAASAVGPLPHGIAGLRLAAASAAPAATA